MRKLRIWPARAGSRLGAPVAWPPFHLASSMEVSGGRARVELGEGIQAVCRLSAETLEKEEKPAEPKTDLSSLTSMLEARWKGGQATGVPRREPVRAGQIRSFRIVRLDAAAKRIELELA